MRAMMRKLRVPVVFCAVVAGVWMLGSVKAELDGPYAPTTQVDPAIVQRAVIAEQQAAAAERNNPIARPAPRPTYRG